MQELSSHQEKAMRRAFTAQRAGACRRGIPFLFRFEEWRA
jgi:hypothetical protein